jgi:hypothetical protein
LGRDLHGLILELVPLVGDPVELLLQLLHPHGQGSHFCPRRGSVRPQLRAERPKVRRLGALLSEALVGLGKQTLLVPQRLPEAALTVKKHGLSRALRYELLKKGKMSPTHPQSLDSAGQGPGALTLEIAAMFWVRVCVAVRSNFSTAWPRSLKTCHSPISSSSSRVNAGSEAAGAHHISRGPPHSLGLRCVGTMVLLPSPSWGSARSTVGASGCSTAPAPSSPTTPLPRSMLGESGMTMTEDVGAGGTSAMATSAPRWRAPRAASTHEVCRAVAPAVEAAPVLRAFVGARPGAPALCFLLRKGTYKNKNHAEFEENQFLRHP